MDTLDLSSTATTETAVLNMLVPGTARETGWKITLAGPSHQQTIDLNNEVARETIEHEKAVEFAQVNNRKWKVEAEDPAVRRRKNVRRICQRIVSWEPNPTFKSFSEDPIPFSVETATELFLRPDVGGYFLQIVNYVNDERAFMPPSGET